MHLEQRMKLLALGNKVIETAILSNYGLKSYDNYEHLEICKHNIANIGKAYNVAGNSTVIFNLENLPDLKSLFYQNKMDFESVFKIRHLGNAKYYRKWINNVGENANAQEITKEYLAEIKGAHKFYETIGGKFLKNVGLFAISSAIGSAVAGPPGAIAGFGIGLLETYWLDSILKGKNPSMFIDEIRKDIQ